VARFGAIPWLKLGIGSRADWMANLLLFVPLTFLWMAALTAGRGWVWRVLVALLTVVAATALSVGIEFTQLFFPQRTVSQNDILAETVGGVAGVLVWWGAGGRFIGWLQGWRATHERAALADRLAWVYLAGVLVYNVMPLDLTISVVEIFHKFQEGKVNLLPFGRLPGDWALAVYEIATDALIWLPLALLWRLDGTRSRWRVWRMTWAAAAVIELLQLFVYSRVSDVTDLVTAAAGAMLGVLIGRRVTPRDAPASASSWALPLALASGWMIVLMFVFWFPFDFRTDGAFIKSRLGFVDRVPFEAYYYGTEFRAITSVLHKTLFFAPLGALLAWFVHGLPWTWRGYAAAGAMLAIVATALGIELGQVLLPGKIPDATDWFLESLGGILGYVVFRMVSGRLSAAGRPRKTGPGARHVQRTRSGQRPPEPT
jgi:glycopeptide antibiotics resistance protein